MFLNFKENIITTIVIHQTPVCTGPGVQVTGAWWVVCFWYNLLWKMTHLDPFSSMIWQSKWWFCIANCWTTRGFPQFQWLVFHYILIMSPLYHHYPSFFLLQLPHHYGFIMFSIVSPFFQHHPPLPPSSRLKRPQWNRALRSHRPRTWAAPPAPNPAAAHLWSHRSSCPDDGPKRENYPRKSGKYETIYNWNTWNEILAVAL